MSSRPKISVVMPAYNAGAYLDEAVKSILNQRFRDFEFIIINDGSTDDTASLLDKYGNSDSRVRVYHQENQGMIAALNRGCRLARGKYIARMDADDISFPTRLERQLGYLEQHPQIGILGSWIYNVDEKGSVKGAWCLPTDPKLLKWTNFFGVPVPHPTVLMRRDVLERIHFYRSDAAHAEDVDLWFRASAITDFGNVPEVLYKYRVWSGSTHQRGLQTRSDRHVQRLASYIGDFLNTDTPVEAVEGLRRTRVGPPFESLEQIRLTARLIQQLYQTFVKENALSPDERSEISWDAARRIASLGLQATRFRILESLFLFLRALKLDHRLLYPYVILRGVHRFLRDTTGKTVLKTPAPVK